jgi:hypothetical protein
MAMASAPRSPSALQDLLFALLGFSGDVIISELEEISDQKLRLQPFLIFRPGTFRVKDGHPSLSEAERSQINRIAPLGRYYVCFEEFVKVFGLNWRRTSKSQSPQLYRLALSEALQDVLQEYTEEIAELEVHWAEMQTMPLSHVLQHTQKVDLPIMHTVFISYKLLFGIYFST